MKIAKYLVAAMLLAVGSRAEAQLLKGTIRGAEVDDAVVSYSPDGYVVNAQTHDLVVEPNGTFVFDMDFVGDYADVELMLGDDMVGAHLVKGKTVVVDLVKADRGYTATYKGAEPKVNAFVNAMKQAFDAMRYWSPDASELKSGAEYRALLEQEYAKVKALLPTIKDKELRAYYAKWCDYEYRWTRIRLLMDEESGKDYRQEPYFKEALADIDVNDPVAYQSNLAMTKLFNATKISGDRVSEAWAREVMQLIDAQVNRPNIRRTFVMMLGQQYFMYGEGDDNSEAFIRDFKAWAGQDSVVVEGMIQQFRDKRASKEATQSGVKAPDIILTDRQGKEVRLSDIVRGKLTYIDVWATWCGPCKKEIPYMARLVEKYKNSDKVQFISVSVDENVEAWKRMIDADKPAWPQYNIHGEVNVEFSKQWGITGIPRFIMIDRDGNILSADATRPSDEKTVETIDNNQ